MTSAYPDPAVDPDLVRRPIGLPRVRRAVCAYFGVTEEELDSDDRHATVARARHVAMWYARQARHSYPEIGRAFGGRDHTTAMSAVRKIEAQRHVDPEIREAVLAVAVGCQAEEQQARAALLVRPFAEVEREPIGPAEMAREIQYYSGDAEPAPEPGHELGTLYLGATPLPMPKVRIEVSG